MSIHDPAAAFPNVPSGSPGVGAVAQVIMLSVQRPFTSRTLPPFGSNRSRTGAAWPS